MTIPSSPFPLFHYIFFLLSPDEYPFTDNLPEPVLPPLHFPNILHPNKINANQSILSFYINAIVPRISRRATLSLSAQKPARGISGRDDDGNYGSAATLDVEVLQSISKRVHYGKDTIFYKSFMNTILIRSPPRIGKFVSESKFLQNPSAFIPHIHQRNREALEALITKPEVEKLLLRRLQKKAETYGQDIIADGERSAFSNGTCGKIHSKIDPDGVVDLYESYIIPLTKEVEVCIIIELFSNEI